MDSYKHTKGRKRLQLDSKKIRFHVFEEYVTSVQAVKETKFLQEEMSEWSNQYVSLELELSILYNEIHEELRMKEIEIEQPKEYNQELINYVKAGSISQWREPQQMGK